MERVDLLAGLRHLSGRLARLEEGGRAPQESEPWLALEELLEELQELETGGEEWWARFLAVEDLLGALLGVQLRAPRPGSPSPLASGLEPGELEALCRSLRALREAVATSAGDVSGSERLLEARGGTPDAKTTFC